MRKKVQTTEYYKSYLMNIYQCKVSFELLVIDKKPKTKMGVYIHNKTGIHRIRIYAKWRDVCPIEEIAIHEYAHHIHETEWTRAMTSKLIVCPDFVNASPKLRFAVRKAKKWLYGKVLLCQEESFCKERTIFG